MKRVDLAALLEAVPDAVLVADMTSRIVYANRSTERLLGWSADELVGRSLHQIQPERLHRAHDASFRRYAESGRKTLFDGPIHVPARRADGGEQDVELNLGEVVAADGQRLVIGVLRDLSERVELERQLSIQAYLKATSQAGARLWSAGSPDAVLAMLVDILVSDFDARRAEAWSHDAASGNLRPIVGAGAGAAASALAGAADIQVATSDVPAAVVARTRQPLFGADSTVDRGGQACVPLLAGTRLIGVMAAELSEPPTPEVAETLVHLAALGGAAASDAQLISQEREARTAADRERARFEILARASESLARSLDVRATALSVTASAVPDIADWCIVDLLSEAGLELLAATHRRPELTPRIAGLRIGYPPANRERPRHAIVRATEDQRTIVETVTDEDLQRRAVDAGHLALLRELGIGSHVVVPLAGRDRVIGALSFVRGPDRSPFQPDEVATAVDIARRTALAIDNALLYRSAQEAVVLRDRFLAIASHELRTPLAVVRGHWELLERRLRTGGDPAELASRLDTTVRRLGQGIDQLQRLVEDLLDGNRLRGVVGLLRSPTDLVMVLRDVIGGLPAKDRRRVRARLPAGPVAGLVDPQRLAQVVSNVLTNALKYAPDGPVLISLHESDGRARIEVADSGIGIAADHLESIFEPFSRAPDAVAKRYSGFGLGLAISREIIAQMGGRLWAESAGEGQGSTFIIELPLQPHGEPQDDAEKQAGE